MYDNLPVLTSIGLVHCDLCQHVWISWPVMIDSSQIFPSFHLSPVEEESTAIINSTRDP